MPTFPVSLLRAEQRYTIFFLSCTAMARAKPLGQGSDRHQWCDARAISRRSQAEELVGISKFQPNCVAVSAYGSFPDSRHPIDDNRSTLTLPVYSFATISFELSVRCR